MKTKKIKLKELNVISFITDKSIRQLKGGSSEDSTDVHATNLAYAECSHFCFVSLDKF